MEDRGSLPAPDKVFPQRTRTLPMTPDMDPTAKYGGGEGHACGTRSGHLLVVEPAEKSYM